MRTPVLEIQKGQNYKNICYKYREKEIIETKKRKCQGVY